MEDVRIRKLKENIDLIQQSILTKVDHKVDLIAVTKYSELEDVKKIYHLGLRKFAENKVQNALLKIEELASCKDIEWHLIGHLQSNKVKKAVEAFSWIQSVDSLRLLRKLSDEAVIQKKKLNILLQINLAEESNKYGFSVEDFKKLLETELIFANVNIRGIMIMAPFTEDSTFLKDFFEKAHNLYVYFKEKYKNIDTLSMGMSGDYLIAVNQGATMVRIGSQIFKEK